MKEAGIPAAVATVTDAYLIEAALRRCGLLDLLTGVFSCQTLGLSKEDPRIFDTARATLGTERAETAVVEDSFFAATTARAAGYIVVGVFAFALGVCITMGGGPSLMYATGALAAYRAALQSGGGKP